MTATSVIGNGGKLPSGHDALWTGQDHLRQPSRLLRNLTLRRCRAELTGGVHQTSPELWKCHQVRSEKMTS